RVVGDGEVGGGEVRLVGGRFVAGRHGCNLVAGTPARPPRRGRVRSGRADSAGHHDRPSRPPLYAGRPRPPRAPLLLPAPPPPPPAPRPPRPPSPLTALADLPAPPLPRRGSPVGRCRWPPAGRAAPAGAARPPPPPRPPPAATARAAGRRSAAAAAAPRAPVW